MDTVEVGTDDEEHKEAKKVKWNSRSEVSLSDEEPDLVTTPAREGRRKTHQHKVQN